MKKKMCICFWVIFQQLKRKKNEMKKKKISKILQVVKLKKIE